MKYHLKIILAAVTVLFVTAVSATHADLVVNISSNGASYFFDPADPQTASFDHQSGSIGDVLFEDHFLFRWQDDSGFGSETFVASLGALTTGQVQYQGTTNSGDTAVSEWQIWGGLLQPVHLYTVTMTNTISTQNGMAILDYQFDVSNENGTAGSASHCFILRITTSILLPQILPQQDLSAVMSRST